MKSISGSIADVLEVSGVIRHEYVNQCRYGLELLISSMLELVSILVIAAIAGNFLETLLMFAAFIPLRIYAGGYHADTKLKCYFVSLGVYAVFTIIMNVIPSGAYLCVVLSCTIFSLIMVLAAAPVVHRNKTVNDIERKHYRKISITVCI